MQNANATIFRNMALTDPRLAAVRARALRLLGRVAPVVRRITEREALVGQSLAVPRSTT